MTSRLRVLLFGPVPGVDPPSGDTSYTQALLAEPPEGVNFTPYTDALREGSLSSFGRRGTARSPATRLALLQQGAHRVLRGRATYVEPMWHVEAEPGHFDLVHNHTFSIRQSGPQPLPVLSTAGFPLSVLYANREGWPTWRCRLADRLRFLEAGLIGAHTAGYAAPAADTMTVYSQRYRSWLAARSVPSQHIGVLGQGLEGCAADRRTPPDVPLLLFIGRDFERKGGDLAMAAFERLLESNPHARLIVVTTAGQPVRLSSAQVTVVHDVTRSAVRTLLSEASVLCAPTRSDCGAPYGVLEALRAGTPVVMTHSPWLDDGLAPPAVQMVPADSASVADALESLLADRDRWQVASDGARALFGDRYAMSAFGPRLRLAYENCMQRSASTA